MNIVKNHPAETAMPLATVLAVLISKALGVEDTDTIAYIAIALSFVPALVTWGVELYRGTEEEKAAAYATKPSSRKKLP